VEVGQSLDGQPKIYYLELLRASEGTLSCCWSRLHLHGPFSLCVIHKESLCPSSGDFIRLMMKLIMSILLLLSAHVLIHLESAQYVFLFILLYQSPLHHYIHLSHILSYTVNPFLARPHPLHRSTL
jgi:hypothetical protein